MDRQRILMLFGAAWVSAALLTWFVYAKTVAPKTQKFTKVYAATRDLPAGSRLKKSDLKLVNVPQEDAPKLAVTEEKLVVDHVLLMPVSANEPIVTPKMTTGAGIEGVASVIDAGKRAISVAINDTSSAGGLIQPRSHVDVLFTRTGTMKEALTTTILQDVVILSIGKFTEVGQQDPKVNRPQNYSATLLVTPDDANKLELAKNQGKISLVLRNPLDRSVGAGQSVTAESIDPLLFRGAARAVRAGVMGPGGNVRDDKVWNDLTAGADTRPKFPAATAKAEKKEPPKPRYVIDVYHGEKHVQELFQ